MNYEKDRVRNKEPRKHITITYKISKAFNNRRESIRIRKGTNQDINNDTLEEYNCSRKNLDNKDRKRLFTPAACGNLQRALPKITNKTRNKQKENTFRKKTLKSKVQPGYILPLTKKMTSRHSSVVLMSKANTTLLLKFYLAQL